MPANRADEPTPTLSAFQVIYRVLTCQARTERVAALATSPNAESVGDGDTIEAPTTAPCPQPVAPMHSPANSNDVASISINSTPHSESRPTDLNLKYDGLCHIGAGDPPVKNENQDTIVMEPNFANIPGCYLFAVYDGHGRHGAIISQFCAKFINTWLVDKLSALVVRSDDGIVKSLLQDAFQACEDALSTDSEIGFRVKMSGSTATVALVLGGTLYVAGVGDSGAILVDSNEQSTSLTTNHRPELDDERARIEDFGGCIREQAKVDLPTDKLSHAEREVLKANGENLGPLRVWVNNDNYKQLGLVTPGPGLMITRSLGDLVAKAAGCTAVPEIKCTRLEPRVHQYLVLGSDGIWDVIEDEQVTKTVCSNQGDLGAAANSLLQVALQRWSDMNTADNISVIIVSIG